MHYAECTADGHTHTYNRIVRLVQLRMDNLNLFIFILDFCVLAFLCSNNAHIYYVLFAQFMFDLQRLSRRLLFPYVLMLHRIFCTAIFAVQNKLIFKCPLCVLCASLVCLSLFSFSFSLSIFLYDIFELFSMNLSELKSNKEYIYLVLF